MTFSAHAPNSCLQDNVARAEAGRDAAQASDQEQLERLHNVEDRCMELEQLLKVAVDNA